MKQFSDDTLMAFADGELDAATHAEIETALHTDPSIAARVARHRNLRQTVFAGFAEILAEPIPARLQLASNAPTHAAPTDPAVPILSLVGSASPNKPPPLRSARMPSRWSGLAAMLIVGVVAGAIGGNAFNLFNVGSSNAPIATLGSGMVAQNQLAGALSQQLASTAPADAATRIGVSFRTADGRYCRSFTLAATPSQSMALAGLACHGSAQAWQIPLLVQVTSENNAAGNYRRAGSETPAQILNEIDRRMVGTPLDAAGEKAAVARHWLP